MYIYVVQKNVIIGLSAMHLFPFFRFIQAIFYDFLFHQKLCSNLVYIFVYCRLVQLVHPKKPLPVSRNERTCNFTMPIYFATLFSG